MAAHSNQQKHGKGMGIKAHDYYTVWACAVCHTWLDQGKAPKTEKQRAFDAAHKRQVIEWQKLEGDARKHVWGAIEALDIDLKSRWGNRA